MLSQSKQGFNLLHLSLPEWFPLLCLFWLSSVCKSLQGLTSTLTQGGEGGHLFRLTCPVVLWGVRDTANKYHWRVWGVPAVSQPHWVCPRSRRVCFPRLHCSGSRLLCRGTVQSRPWVLCTSQVSAAQVQVLGCSTKAQTCWGLRLCPSQVGAAQATTCLASALSPGGDCVLSPPRSQPLGFLGGCGRAHLRCALCLFWGADLWL